ncbi:hypothetical protein ACQCWA_16770 [Rossellomorea aquimaris]
MAESSGKDASQNKCYPEALPACRAVVPLGSESIGHAQSHSSAKDSLSSLSKEQREAWSTLNYEGAEPQQTKIPCSLDSVSPSVEQT